MKGPGFAVVATLMIVVGLAVMALAIVFRFQSTQPTSTAGDLEQERDARLNVLMFAQSDSLMEDAAAPRLLTRSVEVGRGDTLIDLLVRAGIDRGGAHQAAKALRRVYDPRELDIGQKVALDFLVSMRGESRFHGLALDSAIDRVASVKRRADGGFMAVEAIRPLTRTLALRSGTIQSSLYLAAEAARLPLPILIEMTKLFSFDVDFQRELQPGDRFEVLYDRYLFEDGTVARSGHVLAAKLVLSGKALAMYRFSPRYGKTDYYSAKGRSARKALLRTPIDGARLSSRYGLRRHPILKYSKMHRGIDFAARHGTPIFAAGDGVIERAGRNGAYGKYVRIRHNKTYKTAYAHLNKYGRGIKRGRLVRQGQVIGYVGSTGRSTGPHLHYEVLRKDRQVDPLKLRMPAGETLKGDELAAFEEHRAKTDARIAALGQPDTVIARSREGACGTAEDKDC